MKRLLKLLAISAFLVVGLLGCCHPKHETVEHSKQHFFEGDSVIYLTESENKIELLTPNKPELKYFTEKENTGNVFSGRYVKEHHPIALKNGDIIIYNRFYDIEEKLSFRDCTIILQDHYKQGRITWTYGIFNKDSIHITKQFYDNGNPKMTEIDRINKNERSTWYENGNIETYCKRQGLIEICDFWTDKGYFDRREKYIYSSENNQFPISKEEIDRDNKFVRKIK